MTRDCEGYKSKNAKLMEDSKHYKDIEEQYNKQILDIIDYENALKQYKDNDVLQKQTIESLYDEITALKQNEVQFEEEKKNLNESYQQLKKSFDENNQLLTQKLELINQYENNYNELALRIESSYRVIQEYINTTPTALQTPNEEEKNDYDVFLFAFWEYRF